MKNKKGFTLIELLAVIVILAIIALIAVPIILNVIEKSKESSAVDSAYGYIHAIEEGVVESEVKNGLLAENTEYTDLATFESTYGITVKGNKPTSGLFRLEKRQVVYAEFAIDGYSIVCDKKECQSKGKGELVTITYNLDGGSLNRTEDRLVKGSSINLPVPTKTHYGFDGWYLGDERVNNETVFNEAVTLTAHWTKNRYTIIFDGNGGESTESSLSVDSGDTLNLPSASKEGYTFNGWFTQVNGGDEVTNSTPITSSGTLYAHYTINTYTINFNSNGGSEVSPSSVTVTHGQTLTLPEPTKENYILVGWFTENEGGSEVTNSTPITGSQTLYAHYISAIQNFAYTGAVQEVTLQPGRYKLEVWGAQGGATTGYDNGGYGGYSVGQISLSTLSTMKIIVGGKGGNPYTNHGGNGGFGAGGSGGGDWRSGSYPSTSYSSGGGGGMSGIFLDTTPIIISGGGGGGSSSYNGGHGGGYYGGNGSGPSSNTYGYGALYNRKNTNGFINDGSSGMYNTEFGCAKALTGGYLFGGAAQSGNYENTQCGDSATFAGGVNISASGSSGTMYGSGGGGGGYYGGNGGNAGGYCSSNYWGGSGGGGSGYIGGTTSSNDLIRQMYMYNSGCTSSNDENTKTTCTTNVSETPTSNYAKQGNGYARITYLGSI